MSKMSKDLRELRKEQYPKFKKIISTAFSDIEKIVIIKDNQKEALHYLLQIKYYIHLRSSFPLKEFDDYN